MPSTIELIFRDQVSGIRSQWRRRLAQGGGAAVLGGPGGGDVTPWWLRLSALVPLAVLLAGLVLIDSQYTRAQVEAAAELDAAILADDLPPEAYRDPGFVEFLKTSRP